MRRNAFPQVLMRATTAKQLHNIRITLRINVRLGTIVEGFPMTVQKTCKGTSHREDPLVWREKRKRVCYTPSLPRHTDTQSKAQLRSMKFF